MRNKLKIRAILFLEKIHYKIFSAPMSDEMKVFFSYLSWTFFASMVATPIMMVVATLAGRFMGPTEYGKYNLVLIINQFLLIFIFFGLDVTSVKYLAKAQTFLDRKQEISTTSRFVFSLLIAQLAVALILYPILKTLSISYSFLILVVAIYTFVVTIKAMLDQSIRGMEKFKQQAQGKIIESIIVVILFVFVFILLKKNDYLNFLLVTGLGAITISLFYFRYLSQYFGASDKNILAKRLREGKLFFISALTGTLFMSADKIIVARYLGIQALGVYSAYYFASFGVANQINQILVNIFFPISARLKNKSFIQKIDKLLFVSLAPFTLLLALIVIVIMLIFGKEYPLNYYYVIGFSFFSALYFFQALYNAIIIDASRQEYNKCLNVRIGISAITMGAYILGIYLHIISIAFIIVTLIINLAVSISVQRLYTKQLAHLQKAN